MLNRLEIYNNSGDLLTLALDDFTDGLVLEDVEGMDPVKATLTSSNFAQQDGAQFHAARRDPRNLIIHLGLDPDYTTTSVWDLRKRLYSFFMPKSELYVNFILDDLEVVIIGIVESLDTPQFTKEPKAVVSIMCFDPDFRDPSSIPIDGFTVNDSTDTIYNYEGTVETGITLSLFVDRDLTEFTIYNTPAAGSTSHYMDFVGEFEAGDEISISTITGDKHVYLTRAFTQTSILYALSPQSKWVEFLPGENAFRFYATGDPIPYTLDYMARYGGL